MILPLGSKSVVLETSRRLRETLPKDLPNVDVFSLTDMDREDLRRYYANVGAQLDIRVTFLSYLKTTASLGYAFAVEENKRRTDEFMFSVKIL